MKPTVFVSQPIPDPALEILREVAEVDVFPRLDRNMSEDEWIMAATRSDYLFVMGGNIITGNVIKANPKLKGVAMVHRRLPANNSIDLETARALGVPVLFQYPWEPVYDPIAEATCDLTIAMLLSLAYRMVEKFLPLRTHKIHRTARNADINFQKNGAANAGLFHCFQVCSDAVACKVTIHEIPVNPRLGRRRRLVK